MLTFLLSPLGRLIGVGVACLLCGTLLGYRLEYGALQALKTANAVALANAVQTAMNDERARNKVTHDTDVKYAEEHQKIVTNTITIIRKIHDHIPASVDTPVACGFIKLRDAAALQADPDTLPDATCGPDASPSARTTADLATADVETIGAYYAVSARLSALQDWITAQSAVSP